VKVGPQTTPDVEMAPVDEPVEEKKAIHTEDPKPEPVQTDDDPMPDLTNGVDDWAKVKA